MNITLLSPALKNNLQEPSINLGDLIIDRKIDQILKELFPDAAINRFSTHTQPTSDELEEIKKGDLIIIGGTNILSSDLQNYNQWKLGPEPAIYLEPPLTNVILFGVGWWQHQQEHTTVTEYFYKRILSSEMTHSIRDSYSQDKLKQMNIENTLNTCCPTLWDLGAYSNIRTSRHRKCLCCFTDYRPDKKNDNKLLQLLIEHYPEGVSIFPQGSHDHAYVSSLEAFRENRGAVELAEHDIDGFYSRVATGNVDYIGTRLHAGAYCLENALDSLLIGVDNRALEIGKDVNLPTVERGDLVSVRAWIDGKKIFEPIKLPIENINTWKAELKSYAERKINRKEPPTSSRPTSQNHTTAKPRLLNLGCGGQIHSDWFNVNFTATGKGVIAHDLLKPLPFDDNSFDGLYHSHVLEHMPKRMAPAFLGECYRVLKSGGVIRVVVPDLELAVRIYLKHLELAQQGDQAEITRFEYVVISLLDQMTRHQTGGEMLNFWKQNPMPQERFVVDTHGLEVVRNLAVLRDPKLSAQYGKSKTAFDCKTENDAEEIGKFRTSGEPHLWMYDRVSLKKILSDTGFGNINVFEADSSNIPDFTSYNLDTLSDGSIARPDSLIMEGIK